MNILILGNKIQTQIVEEFLKRHSLKKEYNIHTKIEEDTIFDFLFLFDKLEQNILQKISCAKIVNLTLNHCKISNLIEAIIVNNENGFKLICEKKIDIFADGSLVIENCEKILKTKNELKLLNQKIYDEIRNSNHKEIFQEFFCKYFSLYFLNNEKTLNKNNFNDFLNQKPVYEFLNYKRKK